MSTLTLRKRILANAVSLKNYSFCIWRQRPNSLVSLASVLLLSHWKAFSPSDSYSHLAFEPSFVSKDRGNHPSWQVAKRGEWEDVSYTCAWLTREMLLLFKVIDILGSSRIIIFLILITEGSFLSSILLIFLQNFILESVSITLNVAFAWSSRRADGKDCHSTEKHGNF